MVVAVSEERETESVEDRRQQGIEIPVPWSPNPIKIRGLTTIMGLLLVLTGVSCWTGWQTVEQLGRLGDAVLAQTRAINMQSCMLQEMDSSKRKAQYEECAWRFGVPVARQETQR